MEEYKWRDTFEVARMEQFRIMQQHMSTQGSNFEAFASYVIESLVSLQTFMNDNHVDVSNKINHLISTQQVDYGHYERFYHEMFHFLDS